MACGGTAGGGGIAFNGAAKRRIRQVDGNQVGFPAVGAGVGDDVRLVGVVDPVGVTGLEGGVFAAQVVDGAEVGRVLPVPVGGFPVDFLRLEKGGRGGGGGIADLHAVIDHGRAG